jgi:hypothetical protein
MKTLTRDDTEHDVEYVQKREAESEIDDAMRINRNISARLSRAEEILEILSSGFFVSVLNQNSDDLLEGVGDMVERYWKETTRIHSVLSSPNTYSRNP